MSYVLNITDIESAKNKTQIINEHSTNTQYPSAKAVFDYVGSIEFPESMDLSGKMDFFGTVTKTDNTNDVYNINLDTCDESGNVTKNGILQLYNSGGRIALGTGSARLCSNAAYVEAINHTAGDIIRFTNNGPIEWRNYRTSLDEPLYQITLKTDGSDTIEISGTKEESGTTESSLVNIRGVKHPVKGTDVATLRSVSSMFTNASAGTNVQDEVLDERNTEYLNRVWRLPDVTMTSGLYTVHTYRVEDSTMIISLRPITCGSETVFPDDGVECLCADEATYKAGGINLVRGAVVFIDTDADGHISYIAYPEGHRSILINIAGNRTNEMYSPAELYAADKLGYTIRNNNEVYLVDSITRTGDDNSAIDTITLYTYTGIGKITKCVVSSETISATSLRCKCTFSDLTYNVVPVE